jgi:LysM repeat protein
MKPRRRSPLRILAPLALIAFVVAVIVVASNSGYNGDGGTGSNRSSATGTTTTTTAPVSNKFAHRRRYTVRAGDTLGAIAEKTGVSVSTLEDLNPGLDPQALVAGQKLKLR